MDIVLLAAAGFYRHCAHSPAWARRVCRTARKSLAVDQAGAVAYLAHLARPGLARNQARLLASTIIYRNFDKSWP